MADDLFSILGDIVTTTDAQKRKLRSKIESKINEVKDIEDHIIMEQVKWSEIREKQMREDAEREESDRLATEAFEKENDEIAKLKRQKAFIARSIAKRRKHKLIQIKRELKAGRQRKKREAKSDAELVLEINTKETPDALRKWLYRNLSVTLAPRKPDDPEWNKKNKLLQEIISCRNDLKKLKNIADIHKPEWSFFFKC